MTVGLNHKKNHNHPERTNTIEKCTNDYYIWKIIKFSADRKNYDRFEKKKVALNILHADDKEVKKDVSY